MNADTHDDVVIQFQRGDAHAFGLIFEQYRGSVFNFIYRMLNGDREAAEDLLSEIFMKLHDAREYYEPKAKFSTWLFTIARNHCLNRIKSQSYRQSRRTVYRGRIALHELLEIDDSMRKLINRDPGMDELRRHTLASGLVTLRADGLAKVSQGLTTVEEVLQVCPS